MTRSIAAKNGRAAARKESPVTRKAPVPPVEVRVTFRHVAPTEAIRAYAERKFAHTAKFLKRACDRYHGGGLACLLRDLLYLRRRGVPAGSSDLPRTAIHVR